MKHLCFALALFLAVLTGGCATNQPMALQAKTEQVPTGKPVYLLTVDSTNTYKPPYWPFLLSLQVIKSDDGKETFIPFNLDPNSTVSIPGGFKYLVSIQLDPGIYTLRGIHAISPAFPRTATFYVPIHAPLKAQGTGVNYLGAISATVRERQGNEFRAGPLLSLVEQSVVGASGGTFDITISDRYTDDVALFRKMFPSALKSVPVHKAVLPPFDRAKAQAWWEAH